MLRKLSRISSLVWVVCSCAGSAFAADKWIEVKTPHFTVISNAGEGKAQSTAREFEQVRAAYGQLWAWVETVRSRPIVVLALKDEKTMRRWAPEYAEIKGGIDIVSVSVGSADRLFLVLRTDGRPRHADVTPGYNLYRSYLRLLFSASFERPLPVWLSNGLAAVLGNTLVRDDEVQLGQPVPWQLAEFVKGTRFPLMRVLQADRDSTLLVQESQRRVFDAQCYVLVHYMLFGDRGAHQPQLSQFQQLWLAGASYEEALMALGDLHQVEGALSNCAVAVWMRAPPGPTIWSRVAARSVCGRDAWSGRSRSRAARVSSRTSSRGRGASGRCATRASWPRARGWVGSRAGRGPTMLVIAGVSC